jgi:hypothetical protein
MNTSMYLLGQADVLGEAKSLQYSKHTAQIISVYVCWQCLLITV